MQWDPSRERVETESQKASTVVNGVFFQQDFSLHEIDAGNLDHVASLTVELRVHTYPVLPFPTVEENTKYWPSGSTCGKKK